MVLPSSLADQVGDAWGRRGSRRSDAPATVTSHGAPALDELPVAQATGNKSKGEITMDAGAPNPVVVLRAPVLDILPVARATGD